jgi:hypothetical protein
MHIDAKGVVRVSKREFLGDITTQAAFAVTGTRVEPLVFPWLSQVSTAWEKWIMTGCVFEYVPLSGYAVSGTSAALGSVSMCAITDVGQVSNEFPVTKIDVLTYENSVSGSPAVPMSLGIECAPDQTQLPVKYVRDGSATGATFIAEQVVLAQVQIVTGGSPGTYICGELWATYDIVLLEPRKFNGPLPPLSDLSPLAKEYLKVYQDYSDLVDGSHLINFTPEESLRRQAKIQVLASRLRSPAFEEGRMDYIIARNVLDLRRKEGEEAVRVEKIRVMMEVHADLIGDSGYVAPPSFGGGRTR